MNKRIYIYGLLLSCLLASAGMTSCNHQEEDIPYQSNDCKVQPGFIGKLGFDPKRSAFSTSEKRNMGLVLLQFNNPGDTGNGGRKIYQDPSWKSAGWLGPLQVDEAGNCFTAPIPVINLLDNPPAKQNIIYKVDAASGVMKSFVELPYSKDVSVVNPFGVLGLTYMCESNTLYASSVQGSNRQEENGCIYAIDGATGKIMDKISGIDALGMGISYISGKRTLYFGSARTSDVYSVVLTAEGKFDGSPKQVFSIASFGPRGDDKVRRIKFDKDGNMEIYAVEFNFNLTAPSEKQETVYRLVYDDQSHTWQLKV